MALVQPPAQTTGWSSFWQFRAPAGQGGDYQQRFYRTSEEYRAAVQLGKRGFRKYRAVMRALNGVAPGATTVDNQRRVVGVQAFNDGQSNGGLRTTAVVSNAVTTTTAMRDAINARMYDQTFVPQTYPTERSGNSGGGKLGR